MKVAYNACYGGFSLSSEALDAFAKKKGITLTWYEKMYNPNGYKKVQGIPSGDNYKYQSLSKDFGEWFLEANTGNDEFYYPSFYEQEARIDQDLISVIEELGDKASGSCSKLRIKEIPDGASFEITEYDGFEGVEPPRQSW